MSDDRLRALYDRALAGREAAGVAGEHPSPDELLALVRREPPEAQRLALLDHVMACASCAREFELLRAIEGAGAGVATPARAAGVARPGPWRRAVPVLLAASLVLAVGIGVRDRLGRAPADVARGASDGIALLTPADGATVALPLTLAWRPLAHAGRYAVEVLAADGSVAVGGTTADTTLTLPAGAPLAPGAGYTWWVRADGGTTQVRSPLRAFRVRTE